MPQLQKDLRAFFVHGSGHLAPAIDLRLRVNPRGVLIALALSGDLCGLGDQQAGGRALAVIGGCEFTGHKAFTCPIAGQRRENDSIRQRQGAKRVRREQILIGHGG